MQIVFLCGGLGTRLKSVADDKPKSLILINGKPFLDHIIESIIPYAPSKFHFCVGYKSSSYFEYFNTLNSNIEYSFSIENEKNLLGTGGAIKNALPFLEKNFIVQYGDTLLNLNYKKLFQSHMQAKKQMTMSILPQEKTDEKPNVYFDKDKMQVLYNKDNPPKNSNFIDYGAMVFQRKIFENINEQKFDLSKIQQKTTHDGNANSFLVYNPYIEIGTPEALNKAKKLLI